QSKKSFALHKKVKTLCIDLTKPVEQLKKELNRTTRYQINKAGRDQLSVQFITNASDSDIKTFANFYNNFAKLKGIGLCRNDKVKALRDHGHLIISYVYDQDRSRLCSHLYMVDGERATMLYSCSARFTAEDKPPIQIGRANRFLHWQDIQFFKENGYNTYDYYGLSTNEHNKEQQNINAFKKGFGGNEVQLYQSFIPQTLKGIIMVLLLRIKWRNDRELVNKREIIQER